MPRRYLIVGNGAAGLSAAQAIRERDRIGEITILSEEPHGFYSRPGLAYFPTGTIPESQLFSRGEHEYRDLGVRRLNGRALDVDAQKHSVGLSSGGRIAYDRLLLAPGAKAVRPKIPGIELEGVVTLDNLGRQDGGIMPRLPRGGGG
jgi:NADPH-dependent 2,4-dienoyl-CoA reductase/sulfur reductase-like enzyme